MELVIIGVMCYALYYCIKRYKAWRKRITDPYMKRGEHAPEVFIEKQVEALKGAAELLNEDFGNDSIEELDRKIHEMMKRRQRLAQLHDLGDQYEDTCTKNGVKTDTDFRPNPNSKP